MRQTKQQRIGGAVSDTVVQNGIHTLGLGRKPPLNSSEKVHPVGNGAPRVGQERMLPRSKD